MYTVDSLNHTPSVQGRERVCMTLDLHPFPAYSVDGRERGRSTAPFHPEACMRKLKLDAEALKVESFDAESRPERPRGTIVAREATEFLCTSFDSCGWSEVDCHTRECTTDFWTCMHMGSCCPAICA
jgi:hypothetical protein